MNIQCTKCKHESKSVYDFPCNKCVCNGEDRSMFEPNIKTNADKIRSMSDEELAKFLEKVNETCIVDALGGNTRCDNEDITRTECRKTFIGISKWLQSEAERSDK